ncbi:holin (3TMs family) [Palleronia aestuarii]|uniref:Holin (3TMs family) n=1 Tax=Palleronia aestuarii TaxID=568105 RepID=A0A2W7NBM5_9RHOB|nr:holin (3TMs family) [Palleronia aestuarii]
MIDRLLGVVFGGGGNVIRDTVEIFRENAEASARRGAAKDIAALEQFAAEFARTQKPGLFDRIMDALNRLPRPAMAIGTIGLFVAAMVDPVWFSERMQGIAVVPEPLWWLLGAIVSFYFGARHQAKGQEFRASVVEALIKTPALLGSLQSPDPRDPPSSYGFPESPNGDRRGDAGANTPKVRPPGNDLSENAALSKWRARNGA